MPAQHWSRGGLVDQGATRWGGVVRTGPGGPRVYHAGDSAYGPFFAEIGSRYPGIDVGMLPIGAYDPPWFMSRQHMGPEEAGRAWQILGAKNLGAMHWGTVQLTDEPLGEPPLRLRAGFDERGIAPYRRWIQDFGWTVSPTRVW